MNSLVEKTVAPDKNSSIRCIIFSRNRAMQLDGLLRSLFLHCQDIHQARITVLFKTTNAYHARQYDKLVGDYAGHVVFRKQQRFRRDTLSLLIPFENGWIGKRYELLSTLGSLGPAVGSFVDRVWRRTLGQVNWSLAMKLAPSVSREAYVLFLVDDNIFVRDFRLADVLGALGTNEDLIGFSLRLGENTTYCYSQNHPQAVPDFTRISGDLDLVKYDWTKAEHDFGYPLEISSSLYRLMDILPYILGLSFENPNVLEDRMAFYANSFSTKHASLGCYRLSVTFCNPINIVQNSSPNRAGESLWQHDVEDLAARFEQGERIKVESYNNFVPTACHQEVELVFERHVENE